MARLLQAEETKWIQGRGPEAMEAMTDALFWITESGKDPDGNIMYQPLTANVRCEPSEEEGEPAVWICDMIVQAAYGNFQIFDGELDFEDFDE